MQLLFQLFFLRKREKKVKIAFKLFCIFFSQGPSEREANDWVGSPLSTPASAVTPERGYIPPLSLLEKKYLTTLQLE